MEMYEEMNGNTKCDLISNTKNLGRSANSATAPCSNCHRESSSFRTCFRFWWGRSILKEYRLEIDVDS